MKAKSPDKDATSEDKKELQAFLGIINYLSKFSPSTASVCESLNTANIEQNRMEWNATY